jgi:L-asparaginase II
MANPILVEVTRGDRVESIHRGAIAIVDAKGGLVASLGDVDSLVYPRSALKPIQALPLLESGAAEAFGLGDEEVALACASHSGEPMHTTRVAAWLGRIGLGEPDLACGPHSVRYEPEWVSMVRRGEKPTRIHNNCSGKHSGFLTVARHWDIATRGYEHVEHPVQQAVATALRELAEVTSLPYGIDGCAAPNFMLSLRAFALALAKLAAPEAHIPARSRAVERILRAMTAHPELVAGTGRACTILMRAAQGKAAVKTGAEGVYAGIVPGLGLGIALKADDGAGRAAETIMAAILDALSLTGNDPNARALFEADVLNTRNDAVGKRAPATPLKEWLGRIAPSRA